MEKDEVIATVALKQLEKEMRLRQTITASAYTYYTRGGILAGLIRCVSLAGLIWLLIIEKIHTDKLVLIGAVVIALTESKRQRERFDALVELLEIEKIRTKPSQAIHQPPVAENRFP